MLLGIPISTYLAIFLITLSLNRAFASNSFFRPKTIFKVAIIKTKSATTAFFFSSFPSPHSFLFLCCYDFGASRA